MTTSSTHHAGFSIFKALSAVVLIGCLLILTAFSQDSRGVEMKALPGESRVITSVSIRALEGQLPHVQSVINRVLTRASIDLSFEPVLEIIEPEVVTGKNVDVFEIDGDTDSHKVIFRGSSAIALTAAFGHYLRYFVNCDFHWENAGGYQLKLFPTTTESLPIPDKIERVVFTSAQRYYQVGFLVELLNPAGSDI